MPQNTPALNQKYKWALNTLPHWRQVKVEGILPRPQSSTRIWCEKIICANKCLITNYIKVWWPIRMLHNFTGFTYIPPKAVIGWPWIDTGKYVITTICITSRQDNQPLATMSIPIGGNITNLRLMWFLPILGLTIDVLFIIFGILYENGIYTLSFS